MDGFIEVKNFKLSCFLVILLMLPTISGMSQEQKQEKIIRLEKEIQLLSEKIKNIQAELNQITKDTTISEDEALLKELEAELASKTKEQENKIPQISNQTLKVRQQVFQSMNPNISVIGSFLGGATNQNGVERNVNLSLGEAEFSFLAAVDPYARADFYIAFAKHQEGDSGQAEKNGAKPLGEEEGGLSAELEEAYLTLLTLPNSMQLKLGKFRPKFGKINETHPHIYNFIGLPLMHQNFFGGEGLVDEGASLNWLLPNTKFFQELILGIFSGPEENASFTRTETDNFLYLAHLKNFFDLSDNTSLEIGLGGLSGPYNKAGDRSTIISTDITLKWKPLRLNKYKSFEWQMEALLSRRDEPAVTIKSIGFFSHLRYQVAKRWFLGYLFDYSEFPDRSDLNLTAHSGILQLFATEFQKFELQGRYNTGNFGDDFFDVQVRAVFVIGSHGAHQY